MVRRTERIPIGGAIMPYDPIIASLGYMSNPGQSFNAYGNRQFQSLLGAMQPRYQNVYAGVRQGLNMPVSRTANIAKVINPASRSFRYGAIGGRALPWLPVATNVLEGDLGGAAQSGIGGVVGGVLTGGNPLGIAAGTMLGEPIIGGALKLAGGAVGIDSRNPLSGPDWSLGPLALTPYAKTKKQTKRAVELAKLQMPLYNEIADRQSRRDQALQSLADAGSIISNVYSNNPYR